MHWIGVDVGGTFTDVVVYDEGTGLLDVAKSPTTRANPMVGLLNALGKLSVSLSEAGRVEVRHLPMPPIPGGLVSG